MTLMVTVTNMRSFWSDPYLWIHLAGLAALPLFLELCFLGLAVGDPVLPFAIEVLLVAVVGITPILWMQWQRPFCIFSLVALAVKPEFLTEQQRRILRLFKGTEGQALAGGTAIALLLLLWQLYRFSPLGTQAAAVLPQTRLLGLGLAAIAFLFCNLFLQVPLSVARVMLATDTKLAGVTPYPIEQIAKDFTLIGLRVRQIVPPLLAEAPKLPKAVAPQTKPTPTRTVTPPPAVTELESPADGSPWDEVPEVATISPDATPVLASDLTLATILESISSDPSELENLEAEELEATEPSPETTEQSPETDRLDPEPAEAETAAVETAEVELDRETPDPSAVELPEITEPVAAAEPDSLDPAQPSLDDPQNPTSDFDPSSEFT